MYCAEHTRLTFQVLMALGWAGVAWPKVTLALDFALAGW